MNEKISWSNFDGTSFQKFCNALLLTEVSRHARVYSAPGKDGGIDQLFDGTYDGKPGKWRFQDKFHSSKKPSQDFQELKRDVEKDILGNFSGEQHIVYITNVNLNPKQEDQLKAIANKTLSTLSIKPEVHFWHHARLEALISLNPLLYHWYWYPRTFLRPFTEYFLGKLEYRPENLLFQLGNPFAGRSSYFGQLSDFLSEDISTLIVAGNGGMGKTRLCIEFFKQLAAKQEQWLPLVLTETGFEVQEFERLLLSNKHFIILVDDAHTIKSEIGREIKRLADASNGKVKLMLTVRRNLADQVIRNFPSQNQDIIPIELDRLNPNESKEVFKQELPSLDDSQLSILAEKSSGIPFVILAYCETIRQNRNSWLVTESDAFATHLRQILIQTEDVLMHELDWPKNKIRRAIHNVCLFNPIPINTHNRTDLSIIFDLKAEELTLFLKRANESGLLLKNDHEFSLSPDPYRDFILTERLKDAEIWLNATLQSISNVRIARHMMLNLLQVPAYESSLESLERFVSRWIDNMKHTEITVNDFKETIELVGLTTPYATGIGLKTVHTVLDLYEDKDHPLHTKFGFMDKKSVLESQWHALEIILESVFINSTTKHQWQKAFMLLERYCNIRSDFAAVRICFTYRLDDFSWEGYKPLTQCGRQLFVKDIITFYLSSGETQKELIALHAAEALLSDIPRDSVWRGRVPDRPEVKQIHAQIIPLLIDFYATSSNQDHCNIAFNHLVRRLNVCASNFG